MPAQAEGRARVWCLIILFGQAMSLNQPFLPDSGPSFNLCFSFPRFRNAAEFFAVNQSHGPTASGVFRTRSIVMFSQPVFYINGNARIQRAIPAPDHVEKPFLPHRHRLVSLAQGKLFAI